MSRPAARRAPDSELYDRACDLLEAATAIRRGVTEPDAWPAFPALLGCLEAALCELGHAAAALQHASETPETDAIADRLQRGYANLRVAVQDAEAASRAARRLAARAAGARMTA